MWRGGNTRDIGNAWNTDGRGNGFEGEWKRERESVCIYFRGLEGLGVFFMRLKGEYLREKGGGGKWRRDEREGRRGEE